MLLSILQRNVHCEASSSNVQLKMSGRFNHFHTINILRQRKVVAPLQLLSR